ncbi:helix-turn-helix domain-containing protein [Sinomonas sp. JGH33]|uniref:Helix-turn-helix domain-containing protein n=1 Tax=Sinomonas terricola TaxID=3110330 RepID=A0ABU5TBC6_9MICC|nr:helix-turn-helix domain-containing protein [Sinomonas sp. JGH33]MEA5456815.1 helix-turn-helix domain-containing protein [Sinomonas sp. JGH33]
MRTIKTAADLGTAIRSARLARGLSQADLAERAGVSRKLILDLEAGKEGAALGTALAVASVLGLSWMSPDDSPQTVLEEGAEGIRRELARGDTDMALRLALDATRRLRSMAPKTLKKPRSTGDAHWDALLAAGARIAVRGTGAKPRWGKRLPTAWFPAADTRVLGDAYRRLTVRRTPKELADFNIFLNDKSLADR